MELLASSDIYGNVKIVEELMQRLDRGADRITVLAGDIGIYHKGKNYRRTTESILQEFADVSKMVIYVPGDTDSEDVSFDVQRVVNVDKDYEIVNVNGVKLGFFGLGGALRNSVREPELSPYLWDESMSIVRDDLLTRLKINVEKVMLDRPDYAVLVTHSPPYGVADRSKSISLNEMVALEEILEEEEEIKGEEKKERLKYTSPKRLGSRVIRDFVRYYQPDIHLFGHVHKQGGTEGIIRDTRCFNVSHLSPVPYRLTGRKFLMIKLKEKKNGITPTFSHVIDTQLAFESYIETYL